MIDDEGFRANVGIILANCDGKVFWCKRIGQAAWQFPQGGIQEGETPLQAMFRELKEETGLHARHVEVIAETRDWLRYYLPKKMIRYKDSKPICIGQKQRWFLLKMNCDESRVQLDASGMPEFDGWKWVNYWLPAKEVVYFKRRVYERALQELAHHIIPLTQESAAKAD